MIPNCRGCWEEYKAALYYQEVYGLYLCNDPFTKGHFYMILSDDKGIERIF